MRSLVEENLSNSSLIFKQMSSKIFFFINIDFVLGSMRGADGVMHLYGTDAIAPSLRMPDKTTEALRRNVMATANVLQAAHDARLHKAVYASNAHFYGDHPDIRLTENVTHEPSSPMAASKHMAEQIMHLYTDFFDVRTVREFKKI